MAKEKIIPIDIDIYEKLEHRAMKLNMTVDEYADELFRKEMKEPLEQEFVLMFPKKVVEWFKAMFCKNGEQIEIVMQEEIIANLKSQLTDLGDDEVSDIVDSWIKPTESNDC